MDVAATPADPPSHGRKATLQSLTLAAVGVVFGDIGTSPLYTFKEAFSPHYGLSPDHDTVLGILSLIFWALLIVVTLKYVVIIMRADNEGEGGIMALMALVQRSLGDREKTSYLVGILGIFGASLFFGDGVITPAISVLGAVEGLEVAAPHLHRYIVPIAVVILFVLFATQRFGTAAVGRLFGPVTAVWFIAIASIGVLNIVNSPEVLGAFNPWWAVNFFGTHGWHSVLILGAVVLAVTGGEALYADMGHFGPKPIRYAWTFFVLPALLLNYLGQGALLLENAAAVKNPFFMAVPAWAQYPMIGLATAAAVIASQAVITGAFSVARQAMQLGYLPRLAVSHTSQHTMGQVYLPGVNRVLMLAVIALVIAFGSSTALASAYGVSVSGTMLIDTILLAMLARASWPRWRAIVVPLCVVFAIIDVAFLIANGVKLLDGAWFPIVLGIVIFTLMRTWRRGREILSDEIAHQGGSLPAFFTELESSPPRRVPGTAVFLGRQAGLVPHALVQNIRHNKVLHERNFFLTVETIGVPFVALEDRLKSEPIAPGAWQLTLYYGFMERPDVPLALATAPAIEGQQFDAGELTYFASHQTIVASKHRGMPVWRDRLYALMHRNAAPATQFFQVPGNRLVEMGATIEI